MRKLMPLLLAVAGLVAMSGPAPAFFLDFENGTDGATVTDIAGVTFETFNGYDAIYGDSQTDLYNTYSDEYGMGWNNESYHHNGYSWLWAGPNANAQGVIVDFSNNDGTYLTTGYSALNTFYMDAYLTDGSWVYASQPTNLSQPMGYIGVTANANTFIDYVVLHDTGNFWLVDDMSGDATGVTPVPEPSALLLLAGGLVGAGFVARRRRSA